MKSKKQKKVAIYARVATENQNGLGVKEQLKELNKCCRSYRVVEYSDIASGLSKERSGLDRLIADAKNKVFGTLYIVGFDRLARDIELLGGIMKELERNKVKVITLNGDSDVPFVSYIKCQKCSRIIRGKKP